MLRPDRGWRCASLQVRLLGILLDDRRPRHQLNSHKSSLYVLQTKHLQPVKFGRHAFSMNEVILCLVET